MPYHSKAKTEKLHNALQERLDRLVTAMYGTDVHEEDAKRGGYHGPQVSVRSDDVRIAVDDFQTILKEIRSSLGKR